MTSEYARQIDQTVKLARTIDAQAIERLRSSRYSRSIPIGQLTKIGTTLALKFGGVGGNFTVTGDGSRIAPVNKAVEGD
jgi:hypothetical protein